MYYVFRITNDPKRRSMLRKELIVNGTLRQGWGAEGMTIMQGCDEFISAWRHIWGDSDASESYMTAKWNNLRIIEEMAAGDIIVIPKLSLDSEDEWSSFTIVRKTDSPYRFEVIADASDFGHIIPVEPIVSFGYIHNDATRVVSAKFKAYQRPVNRVYAEDFCRAVDRLLEEYNSNPQTRFKEDMSPIEALSAPTASAKKDYIKSIVSQINQWQPQQLEKIIEELFTKNGYTKLANNRYDRMGGDIDLIFDAFAPNTFMADIFGFSSSVSMPEIRIQAKNKRAVDTNDMAGVEQLIKMDGHESSINILINTTENFSDNTKSLAAEKGVILINGTEFASLLIKYGLDIIG